MLLIFSLNELKQSDQSRIKDKRCPRTLLFFLLFHSDGKQIGVDRCKIPSLGGNSPQERPEPFVAAHHHGGFPNFPFRVITMQDNNTSNSKGTTDSPRNKKKSWSDEIAVRFYQWIYMPIWYSAYKLIICVNQRLIVISKNWRGNWSLLVPDLCIL